MRSDNLYSFVSLLCREEPRFVDGFDVQGQKAFLCRIEITLNTEVEALPDCITEFRTDYWGHLVEKVTVHRKGAMTFTLSFGVEIEI